MATTIQKLVVEVVDARNLVPKDGHGTSSPYVVVDYYGQRKKTKTVLRDINPTWNEVLRFNVEKPSDVFSDMLELDVYHDKNLGPTSRNNSLGRLKLSSGQFVKKGEEALIYYPLERKYLLSWIRGEIGLKVYYVDEVVLPPPPPVDEKKAEEVKVEPPADNVAAAVLSDQQQTPAEEMLDGNNAASQVEATAAPPVEPPEAGEGEKGAEAEGEKPAEGDDQVEPGADSQSVQADDHDDDIVLDPTSANWAPAQQPGIMASTTSGSIPEIKVARTTSAPPPLTRPATPASYASTSLDSPDHSRIERSSFDLVDKMHYVFVKVVKAGSLPTNGSPVVKIAIAGSHVTSKPARKAKYFEWDQTFAFARDAPETSSILEISVWADAGGANFLGGICFDATEIPLRDPPDSPLAPQWYRLEGGGAHRGDLMLATWIGTQADEAFPDSWKSDTGGNLVNSRAKIYLSPKLWYLRASILEAQDILPLTALKEGSFQMKAQLGFQVQKTKVSVSRNGNPSWNEDLMFVAAEPFSEHLIFYLEYRQQKGPVTLGVVGIPLSAIERRVDDRKVISRWFNLEDPKSDKKGYKGRVHLSLCFDGGYHVMDEAAHVCSDYRPTARQLWKPPVGTLELGIIGCKNLLPMKTTNGKGSTDAYTVAKYGSKWVRTRTVSDTLDPKWNEQYTWKVYDPCTVLTIGVFDSWGALDINGEKEATRPDFRMGKVRVRVSTLETGKVYKNTYPLVMLGNSGVQKMGELEVAVRFVRAAPTLDFLHVYSQPLLPLMHHIKPLGMGQQEMLRSTAVKIMAAHLSRSEPPLRSEVVRYMLDADSHTFSMRKVRANWSRIVNVSSCVIDIVRWIENTRGWKNPTATILVHALLVMLVWFPDLIVPTLAFYVSAIGIWNYRFRSKDKLPHFCPKISLADTVDRDELDEEFDTVPSTRSPDIIRMRYDKLRAIGARVQNILGDFATQGERVQALVTWRDPRATAIFVVLCLMVAFVLYLVPPKMVAMAFGFYYFRHPLFRDQMPSPVLNFFRRLPSLSDKIM
ncbi:multiple C2 domain and transmembrane region protein 16 [Hibiscus trionum]|uniref:Multiple C2 domain and transmembrane region protein 16 n=1 Tax=Hibiscus trionum TaxID=183268 RepID=A0A9W7HKG9_HIBTR|nr:multiple C2 domain and transmembrane region protein 16 [Hibiscus trionum]